MTHFFSDVKEVYHSSVKARDIFWNVYVARPLAAVLVSLLRATPVTPNQISFLGALIFFGAGAVLALRLDHLGFLIGIGIVELSYLFDCCDGQLARLKGMTSDVGAYLDFFVDEIKAFVLVAAMALRLFHQDSDPTWLLVGMGGVMLVAVATSLTTFVRRKEYTGQEQRPGIPMVEAAPKTGLLPKLKWAVERSLRWIVHYPSWLCYLAIANFWLPVDGALVFLVLFLGTYLLYVGRTGLSVIVRLGRSSFYQETS